MAWARLDDGFADHPKVAALSDRAFRLHVAALCQSARLALDGLIDAGDVPRLVRGYRRSALTELVEAGLWHEPGHRCEHCAQPAKGALILHDFLAYNPSKEQRERERAEALERKRRWKERQAEERRSARRSERRQNSVRNAYPDPTRPEGPGSESVFTTRGSPSAPAADGGADSPDEPELDLGEAARRMAELRRSTLHQAPGQPEEHEGDQ